MLYEVITLHAVKVTNHGRSLEAVPVADAAWELYPGSDLVVQRNNFV